MPGTYQNGGALAVMERFAPQSNNSAQICDVSVYPLGETGEKWAIIRKSTLKNREK